jgi:hypothetical protein
MRELFLPFHRIYPLVFRRGISTEPRVPHAPPQAFCDCPFFPLCSSAILRRRRHLFPHHRPKLISTLMAGKSQVLPADVWVRSSVMERKLEELVRDGLLRPRASLS